MGEVKISNIEVTDTFWRRYRRLVRKEMIPYQWNVLNDTADIKIEKERNDASIPSEKSHAIENFKIAAGRSRGEHYGWVFQDSDVYKWLEAAAYSLKEQMDEELKKTADEVVELIAAAQEADGYLDTYFSIKEPDRKFKRLSESHELYCAGHFIEAAVAYYDAVGNELVLETAKKLADHIDHCFGPEEGKIHGVDGHEEVEIGLMRLYHLTGEERYLKLAAYFVTERGKDPDFFERQNREDTKPPIFAGSNQLPKSYNQMHLPIEQQDTAEGHAVRLVYMCTGLADVAATTGDVHLQEICKRIWRNIVDKRMFITGGIGSTVIGESFTFDYDLPNDTMYCETCASIGLIFFARQMLRMDPNGEYADVMERALYNTALAGMALDGKHFFYVNPLEVVPEKSKKDPAKSHVKIVRPAWLGCACCPPNLARMITSVENYIYTVEKDRILVNLYIASETELELDGKKVCIGIETDYPKSGLASLHIKNESDKDLTIGIRIPAWEDQYEIHIQGAKEEYTSLDGYCYVTGKLQDARIDLKLGMQPKRWYASPKVSEDITKTAISRGPQVYCVEGVDNGEDLHCLLLPQDASLKEEWQEELLGGVYTITATGERIVPAKDPVPLYTADRAACRREETQIRWIPYYAWANRGENEMRVWINETETKDL